MNNNNFKGFVTPPPEPELIRFESGTKEEMDRAMRTYLRQGLSQEKAMNRVAASVMFLAAREAGMVEGVDYTWGSEGTVLSPRMTDWMKDFSGEQQWNHLEMEGFVNKLPQIPDPEPDVALTAAGMAKLILLSAKDPDDPNVDPKKARSFCIELLKSAGLSPSDAENKLRLFLNDEATLEELMEVIEAGIIAAIGAGEVE
jgi:hypothetical protein